MFPLPASCSWPPATRALDLGAGNERAAARARPKNSDPPPLRANATSMLTSHALLAPHLPTLLAR